MKAAGNDGGIAENTGSGGIEFVETGLLAGTQARAPAPRKTTWNLLRSVR